MTRTKELFFHIYSLVILDLRSTKMGYNYLRIWYIYFSNTT